MTLIVDLSIHEKAKLSRKDYLNHISPVEAIRGNLNRNEEGLSLYIHSVETFMLLKHIQAAILKKDFDGINGRYGCYHAAIDISDPLYSWLQKNDADTILRQIICWLAALYAFNSDSQEIMEEQLYPIVFNEVQQIANKFMADQDQNTLGRDKKREIYHSVARKYYGSLPPKLLWEPCAFNAPFNSQLSDWGVHDRFDLTIRRFYFTQKDWERIVIKGEEDDLLRVESDKEYWKKIKHQYIAGEKSGNNIFSLFERPSEQGKVYLIRLAETNHYKIGYTNGNPQKRLAQLQTGNSQPLYLIKSFSCVGTRTEKTLHTLFQGVRLSGEWFELTEFDVKNILNEEWRIENNVF